MDTLMDEEIHNRVVGRYIKRDHRKQFLSYKHTSPRPPAPYFVIENDKVVTTRPKLFCRERPSKNAQPGVLSASEVDEMHEKSLIERVDSLAGKRYTMRDRTGRRILLCDPSSNFMKELEASYRQANALKGNAGTPQLSCA